MAEWTEQGVCGIQGGVPLSWYLSDRFNLPGGCKTSSNDGAAGRLSVLQIWKVAGRALYAEEVVQGGGGEDRDGEEEMDLTGGDVMLEDMASYVVLHLHRGDVDVGRRAGPEATQSKAISLLAVTALAQRAWQVCNPSCLSSTLCSGQAYDIYLWDGQCADKITKLQGLSVALNLAKALSAAEAAAAIAAASAGVDTSSGQTIPPLPLGFPIPHSACVLPLPHPSPPSSYPVPPRNVGLLERIHSLHPASKHTHVLQHVQQQQTALGGQSHRHHGRLTDHIRAIHPALPSNSVQNSVVHTTARRIPRRPNVPCPSKNYHRPVAAPRPGRNSSTRIQPAGNVPFLTTSSLSIAPHPPQRQSPRGSAFAPRPRHLDSLQPSALPQAPALPRRPTHGRPQGMPRTPRRGHNQRTTISVAMHVESSVAERVAPATTTLASGMTNAIKPGEAWLTVAAQAGTHLLAKHSVSSSGTMPLDANGIPITPTELLPNLSTQEGISSPHLLVHHDPEKERMSRGTRKTRHCQPSPPSSRSLPADTSTPRPAKKSQPLKFPAVPCKGPSQQGDSGIVDEDEASSEDDSTSCGSSESTSSMSDCSSGRSSRGGGGSGGERAESPKHTPQVHLRRTLPKIPQIALDTTMPRLTERQQRQEKLDKYSSICSQVTPSIYLSSEQVARDLPLLLSHGITHIVNAGAITCPDFHRGTTESLTYRSYYMPDRPAEDIECIFYDAYDFIHSALTADSGAGKPVNKVLVHCHQGVSRSAALIIAYLMLRDQVGFDTALAQVKAARPISSPNAGFTCQLLDLQTRLSQGVTVPRLYRAGVLWSGSRSIAVAVAVQPVKNTSQKGSTLPSSSTLRPDGCFVLQCPLGDVFVWVGSLAPSHLIEMAHCHARRLRVHERGNEALIIAEGKESELFWSHFQDQHSVQASGDTADGFDHNSGR